MLFIIRLRAYDDVKDADTDRTEHPDRPIPRGLVTVRELDVAAVLILIVEGVLLACVGKLAFAMWALCAAWSVLMRLEFFVSTWLEAHIATYAISHMVVMGLLFGCLLAIGADVRGADGVGFGELWSSPAFLFAMLAATSIGIGFEWGRKFERYERAHGMMGWVWWIIWPTAGIALFAALAAEHYASWVGVALWALAGASLVAHGIAAVRRRALSAKALEATVEAVPGIFGLLGYLVLAIAGVMELMG